MSSFDRKVIGFVRLHPDAIIPTRAHPNDAGLDLSSREDTIVPAHDRTLVSTGLRLVFPEGSYYARIAPRSGLAIKFGIDVGGGIIDQGYEGELRVILFNHGKEDFQLQKGDRIAQLVIGECLMTDAVEKKEVESTSQRGAGGFGSSGIGNTSVCSGDEVCDNCGEEKCVCTTVSSSDDCDECGCHKCVCPGECDTWL